MIEKLSDINFSTRPCYKFRSAHRITLIRRGENGVGFLRMSVGFNSDAKAEEALAFLRNLIKTQPDEFLNIEYDYVPRVKGRISFSQAKKQGRVIGVRGACPDLVKIMSPVLGG